MQIWNLIPINKSSSPPLSPAATIPLSAHAFDCSGQLIQEEAEGVHPSVTGLLISLSRMSSGSIHAVADVRTSRCQCSFLRLSNILLYVYATFCLCIHLLTDLCIASTFGYCECVRISVQVTVFISFAYIPQNATAGSYGSFIFKLLRNCRTVFCRGPPVLQSYQQCTQVLISPRPHQRFVFSGFV